MGAAGAAAGAIFSAVSTGDFIRHLDRQVHSIHCSFIPGAGAEVGESGCRTVLMSPYSSWFRDSVWGGIPISLLSLAVFCYLTMTFVRAFLSRAPFSRHEALYLLAATLLPVGTSLVYGNIALNELDAVCKLCVGVYVSSAVACAGAVATSLAAAPARESSLPMARYAMQFGEGVVYVSALVLAYVLFAPGGAAPVEGCGTLVKRDDGAGIMIPLGAKSGAASIAVLDPLCPACKGFDARLKASGLHERLALDTVLFPLDAKCNWMVKDSLHPGACAVSEAMLCAASADKDGSAAGEILAYAFAEQASLLEMGKTDEDGLRRRLAEKFPAVRGCLGSAKIRNQLNKSLRWAVANALPVLTPQLFIGDTRVCDEDTDLGLEYTVSRLLETSGAPGASKR